MDHQQKEIEQKYCVGIYCRLSKDDDLPGESSSIATQKAMLGEYCSAEGHQIFDYYIDDGFTGTNFERAEFQRLLRDIDDGKINMVLTKDLSRLGRDYIQMGYYTEIFFPAKGIRYVALSDGFDSIKESNDIAPFMNILNDMYARDISRKVKAAKLQRAKNGFLTASEAPYGYRKAGRKLDVDPEAAETVRLIFELAASGMGEIRIAKELENRGIPSPIPHKISTGQRNSSDLLFEKGKEHWAHQTIGTILNNRVYLGELQTHRTETLNHKTKQKRVVPIEERYTTEAAHPAIVEESLFRQVQAIRAKHFCPAKQHHEHIFRGLVYCSDCGHPLSVAHRKLLYREEDVYRCVNHFRNPQDCQKTHSIYYSVLYQYVLSQITALAKSMKRRKVSAPITKYSDATALDAALLNEVIERIEIGHMGKKTPVSSAVRIIWKF